MTVYALQVLPGYEAEAANLVNQRDANVAASVPCSEFEFVSNGVMCDEVRPMVPGLVLLEADDDAQARKACRRARGLGELRVPNAQLEELAPEEAAVVLDLCGQEHVAAFSEGTLANGQLAVKQGALAGREGLVGRINHRNKCAYIPVGLGGSTVELQVGLRVTRKPGRTAEPV